MAKKETNKAKWQRLAKSVGVKFQDNDTIGMLITATAHAVGVNPTKLTGAKLEVAVEKAVTEKNSKPTPKKEVKAKATPKDTKKATAKKPTPKATPKAKKTAKATPKKKSVKINPPKDLAKKEVVELPNFEGIPQMKHFCVERGLNRIDGYILQTKGKKADFLNWIKDNIDKATVTPVPHKLTDNPHSPHEGIGELATTPAVTGNTPPPVPSTNVKVKASLKETEAMNVPPISTGEVSNEMPNAISENKKMFEPNFEGVEKTEEKPVKSDGNKKMEAYGKSIVDTLTGEVMFRINGGITTEKLNGALATASKEYEYEVVSDQMGRHLILSDRDGNSCRVPQQGSLPMV